MSEELLDVIDDTNTAIGVDSYHNVHQQHARHRVAHVLITNKEGKLLLQKRAATVKAFPLHWTFSAGGHVRSGEDYKDAMLREVDEELGLHLQPGDLTLVQKGFYDGPDNHHVYFQTYTAQREGPFYPNEDVAEVEFVDAKDIAKMVEQGEKFHPEFLYVLGKTLNK